MSMSAGLSSGAGWVNSIKKSNTKDAPKKKPATYGEQTAEAGFAAANTDMTHMGMQPQQTEGGYAALQAAMTQPQTAVEPLGMQTV